MFAVEVQAIDDAEAAGAVLIPFACERSVCSPHRRPSISRTGYGAFTIAAAIVTTNSASRERSKVIARRSRSGRDPVRRSGVRSPRIRREDYPRPAHENRRSEEHTSELQSLRHLVCRLLLEKKNKTN